MRMTQQQRTKSTTTSVTGSSSAALGGGGGGSISGVAAAAGTTPTAATTTTTAATTTTNINSSSNSSSSGSWRHFLCKYVLAYGTPVGIGIMFPLFKVSMIALSEKLFRGALLFRSNLPDDLIHQIQVQIFEPYLTGTPAAASAAAEGEGGTTTSTTTSSYFLLYHWTFTQVFVLTTTLAVLLALFQTTSNVLKWNYLNRIEVKRLQQLVFHKLLLRNNNNTTTTTTTTTKEVGVAAAAADKTKKSGSSGSGSSSSSSASSTSNYEPAGFETNGDSSKASKPNSGTVVSLDVASHAQELVYKKIDCVNQYFMHTKYKQYQDGSSMICGFVLLVVLAWDLALMCIVGVAIISVVSTLIWTTLSTPYTTNYETKLSKTNGRLIDLVTCYDVVLTHTTEYEERYQLRELIASDSHDLRKIVSARLCSELFRATTFTMLMPSVFLYVYLYDFTLERVFQLLIIMVIMDEIMRCYLCFFRHEQVTFEYNMAVRDICAILHTSAADAFPSDWFTFWSSTCVAFKALRITLASIITTARRSRRSSSSSSSSSKRRKIPRTTTTTTTTLDAHADESMTDNTSRYDIEDGTIRCGCRSDENYGCNEELSCRIPANNCIGGKYRTNMEEVFQRTLLDTSYTISLRDVCLGYDRTTEITSVDDGTTTASSTTSRSHIIDKLNLEFQVGTHYAILGESGTGKSTLLKALMGLLPTQDGTLCIGKQGGG